jgi:hypothetical protein
MATNNDQSRAGAATEPPEMTVDEVVELYPGQWILMRVTGLNEHKDPWQGQILAASYDEDEITEALGREPRPSSLPTGTRPPLHYIFQANPSRYGGEGLLEQLAQLEDEDDLDASSAQG